MPCWRLAAQPATAGPAALLTGLRLRGATSTCWGPSCHPHTRRGGSQGQASSWRQRAPWERQDRRVGAECGGRASPHAPGRTVSANVVTETREEQKPGNGPGPSEGWMRVNPESRCFTPQRDRRTRAESPRFMDGDRNGHPLGSVNISDFITHRPGRTQLRPPPRPPLPHAGDVRATGRRRLGHRLNVVYRASLKPKSLLSMR